MRFLRSICALVISLAVIVFLPILIPAAILAKLAIPGVAVWWRTSDRFRLNLASYHSPYSLTWSWIVSFRRPRSSDEGRWLSCYITDSRRLAGLQIARCELTLHRQSQMPIFSGRSTA